MRIVSTAGGFVSYFAAALVMSFAWPALLHAQSVQITSPAEGTQVRPGQTISVTVSSSGGLAAMFVIGQDPLDGCQAEGGPTYMCSLQVPTNTDPGSYRLTALGATSSGAAIESDPIDIDVERADRRPCTCNRLSFTYSLAGTAL